MKRGQKAVNQARSLQVDGRGAARRWLGALLPLRCLVCEAPGVDGLDLCSGCLADLPLIQSPCIQCGLPLPSDRRHSSRCATCLRKPPPFDQTFAPLVYANPVDSLISRFKHQRNLSAGRVLARVLVDHLNTAIESEAMTAPDCLVAVPLHRWRYWRRGFNQAQLLAVDLGKALDIPVQQSLIRSKNTPHQQGLAASTRRVNLRGAFRIKPDANVPACVALIDDVMTTGATASECARVLKRAGAETVFVWSIARTPKPG